MRAPRAAGGVGRLLGSAGAWLLAGSSSLLCCEGASLAHVQRGVLQGPGALHPEFWPY